MTNDANEIITGLVPLPAFGFLKDITVVSKILRL